MHKLLRLLLMAALVATVACGPADEEVTEEVTEDAGDPAGTSETGYEDAEVSFESPSDGATVGSPVTLVMAASGVSLEPGGEVNPGAGHLHVMIDTECVPPGETVPSDESHVHFGAEPLTEREIELEPGEHTLCLQLGDGVHTATDVTETITITVE